MVHIYYFHPFLEVKLMDLSTVDKCKVDIEFSGNKTQFLGCLNEDYMGYNTNNCDSAQYITSTYLQKMGGSFTSFTSFNSFNIDYNSKKEQFDSYVDSLSLQTTSIISSDNSVPFYDIIPHMNTPLIEQKKLINIGKSMKTAYFAIIATQTKTLNDMDCKFDQCFQGKIDKNGCKCIDCNDGIKCCVNADDKNTSSNGLDYQIMISIIACIIAAILVILMIMYCKRKNKQPAQKQGNSLNTPFIRTNIGKDTSKPGDIEQHVMPLIPTNNDGKNSNQDNMKIDSNEVPHNPNEVKPDNNESKMELTEDVTQSDNKPKMEANQHELHDESAVQSDNNESKMDTNETVTENDNESKTGLTEDATQNANAPKIDLNDHEILNDNKVKSDNNESEMNSTKDATKNNNEPQTVADKHVSQNENDAESEPKQMV